MQAHVIDRPVPRRITQCWAVQRDHFRQQSGALGHRQRRNKGLGNHFQPTREVTSQGRRAGEEGHRAYDKVVLL